MCKGLHEIAAICQTRLYLQFCSVTGLMSSSTRQKNGHFDLQSQSLVVNGLVGIA